MTENWSEELHEGAAGKRVLMTDVGDATRELSMAQSIARSMATPLEDDFTVVSDTDLGLPRSEAVRWSMFRPDPTGEFIPGAALVAVYQDEALSEAMLTTAQYVAGSGMVVVLIHLQSATHPVEVVAAAWASVVTHLVESLILDDDASFGLLADGSIEPIFAAYTTYHPAIPPIMLMCPTARGYEGLVEADACMVVCLDERPLDDIGRVALMFGASSCKGDINRTRGTWGRTPLDLTEDAVFPRA